MPPCRHGPSRGIVRSDLLSVYLWKGRRAPLEGLRASVKSAISAMSSVYHRKDRVCTSGRVKGRHRKDCALGISYPYGGPIENASKLSIPCNDKGFRRVTHQMIMQMIPLPANTRVRSSSFDVFDRTGVFSKVSRLKYSWLICRASPLPLSNAVYLKVFQILPYSDYCRGELFRWCLREFCFDSDAILSPWRAVKDLFQFLEDVFDGSPSNNALALSTRSTGTCMDVTRHVCLSV